MKHNDISVVVPVYNNCQTLEPLALRLMGVLENLTDSPEVIIISFRVNTPERMI